MAHCDHSIYDVLVHLFADKLIAGLPQILTVAFNPGSFAYTEPTDVSISKSDGLVVTGDRLHEGRVQIPAVEPYQKVEIALAATAELTSDASKTFLHKVK